MIRSVRIHDCGGPEALRIEGVEVEEPGEGEVRMRIHAIGINRTEITLRSGRLPMKPPVPTKIGFEAAVSWVGADIVRIENGRLAEHWDVLQDEATKAESKSGLPMFGDRFTA